MHSKNLTISVLLVLLLLATLGCGGDEKTPVEIIEPPPAKLSLTVPEIALCFR